MGQRDDVRGGGEARAKGAVPFVDKGGFRQSGGRGIEI